MSTANVANGCKIFCTEHRSGDNTKYGKRMQLLLFSNTLRIKRRNEIHSGEISLFCTNTCVF